MIPDFEGCRPMPRPSAPAPEKPSSVEIQRQLDEHFGHLKPAAPWTEPPVKSPRPSLSPEELQQALDAEFAHLPRGEMPEPRVEGPPPKLSPEEIQQRFDELFPDMAPRPQPVES